MGWWCWVLRVEWREPFWAERLPKGSWSPKRLFVSVGIEGLCVAEEVAGNLCITQKV